MAQGTHSLTLQDVVLALALAPEVVARLAGAQLLCLAVELSGRPALTTVEAVNALLGAWPGLARFRQEIAFAIDASAARSGAFEAVRGRWELISERRLVEILDQMLRRADVQPLLGCVMAPRARPQPAKPPRTAAPGRSPRAPPARRAAPQAVVAAAPPLPPVVVEPPPPPFTSAAPTVEPPDAAALLTLLGGGARDAYADVDLVVRAHALASAERFEQLIAFARLQGVDAHPYQLETARRVLRNFRGRALLADEVGLGKTVEAIIVLAEYLARGMVRRVLVLAPPALVEQWHGELGAKAGLDAHRTDDPLFRSDPAAFWRRDGVTLVSLGMARMQRHAETLATVPWDLVIVDEAHHLKNRTTASFKAVNALKCRFLLLLTATPVENDLEELYNLVTLLKPGQFSTPADFRRQYVDPADPTSPRNREKLRGLLAEIMVRNTRAQSGLKLPPRFVQTVSVEPEPAEKDLYDGVLALFRTHAGLTGARPLLTTLLLEAGSSPQALRDTLLKLDSADKYPGAVRGELKRLAALARGVGPTRKLRAVTDLAARAKALLVFTRFRHTQESVADGLRRAGARVLSFHGGMDAAQKAAAVERFRADGGVLVATDVGSEGVNLQFCHDLVNFDLPWNPMLLEQRIGRLHRMGQEHEVQVVNLCARGTIDERVLDVLDRRVRLFELVVGEMDMVLGNLTDERDFEERVLGIYQAARDDAEVGAGFDALTDELLRARGVYEKARKLDEALFGEEYEA